MKDVQPQSFGIGPEFALINGGIPTTANWQPVPLIYEAYAENDAENNTGNEDDGESASPRDFSVYYDRIDSDLRQLLSIPTGGGNLAIRADVNGILAAVQEGDFVLAHKKLQQLKEDAEELPEEEKQIMLPLIERINHDLVDLTPLQQAKKYNLANIRYNPATPSATGNKPIPISMQRPEENINLGNDLLGKLVAPLFDLQIRPPVIQPNRQALGF